MPAYTQSLMDLGATLCQPRQVKCELCPVQSLCVARAQARPLAYPVKTRKLKRSSVTLWLLWAVNPQGQVWLHKRPGRGIWAGLFSLPVFDRETDLLSSGSLGDALQYLEPWKHVLTHRDLHLHPVRLQMLAGQSPACEGQWVDACDWPSLGLPAPIRSLLEGRRA